MLCLVELCEDDSTDVDASADWTKAISRGGIKPVNNKTYHFFHAVKMNVRQHFSKTSAPTRSKAELVNSIATDEDLLFIGASYQPSGRRKKSRSCYGCL